MAAEKLTESTPEMQKPIHVTDLLDIVDDIRSGVAALYLVQISTQQGTSDFEEEIPKTLEFIEVNLRRQVELLEAGLKALPQR